MLRRSLSWTARPLAVAGWLACAVSVFACASSKNSAGGSAAPVIDRTVLDSTELIKGNYPNAYAAVMGTRPEWLRAPLGPPPQREPNGGGLGARFPTNAQVARATGASQTIGVFVQGTKQAVGISYLNTLPVGYVAWLKHLSPSEAMSIYGPEWALGAIVVRLRD